MNGYHEYYIGPSEATIKLWVNLGHLLHSCEDLFFICQAGFKAPKVHASTVQAITTQGVI